MSENVRKLVGVVAMAVLVVVGVVATSGGDDDFTRNAGFMKLGGIKGEFQQLPEAEQARLAPAFLQQAAPKSLDTGPINKINKEGGPITKGATGYKLKNVIVTSLEDAGKASVLEGRGVDGKGGTSSIRLDTGIRGKTGKAGLFSPQQMPGDYTFAPKAGIWLQNGGTEGVADRIEKCASGGTGFTDSAEGFEDLVAAVKSLKNVLVTSYTAEQATDEDHKDWACVPHEAATANLNQKSEQLTNFDQKTNQMRVGKDEAELLATCMESKVGGVLLKSHTEVMAADCVATVMPALSPERAKRLGTYWQTPEQLSVWTNGNATSVWTNEE